MFQFLKFRAVVEGRLSVLLYTNSDLLGCSTSFREVLKRLANRKRIETVQLTRTDLVYVATAFDRHHALQTPPLVLFPAHRTRVITTAFRLDLAKWERDSRIKHALASAALVQCREATP
jgi:hypothetical protein